MWTISRFAKNSQIAKILGHGQGRGNVRGRRSLRGKGGWKKIQNNNLDTCYWICGRYRHYANECYH